MTQPLLRFALLLPLLGLSAPMLAADAPLVHPAMRAGSYSVTVTEVDIGGNLPPGAAEAVERSVTRPTTICYAPDAKRTGGSRSIIEIFAGNACKAETASVEGQRAEGKMACEDQSTYGSTSYVGTFDEKGADINLTVDMAFRNQQWRLFMTTRAKFDWLGESCDLGSN